MKEPKKITWDEILVEYKQTIPEGAKSLQELIEEMDIPVNRGRRYLRDLEKEGKISSHKHGRNIYFKIIEE